jgi:hypothetical protein
MGKRTPQHTPPALGLKEAIAAATSGLKRRRWIDSLDANIRTELEAEKDNFVGGRIPLTRTRLSEVIAENLGSRGIAVHAQTVSRWLRT